MASTTWPLSFILESVIIPKYLTEPTLLETIAAETDMLIVKGLSDVDGRETRVCAALMWRRPRRKHFEC